MGKAPVAFDPSFLYRSASTDHNALVLGQQDEPVRFLSANGKPPRVPTQRDPVIDEGPLNRATTGPAQQSLTKRKREKLCLFLDSNVCLVDDEMLDV
ncbi:hypothetical protein OPV22_019329 [Ensete ventricosum]|uniref:Uncharacterized protein n=1 Tax=Ensete ventricosum TaxID=4639 RepID=A0AAV8QBN5_ENSVE|nr:hypothetical protein OPV22_019329 [Ensete ventricosum]